MRMQRLVPAMLFMLLTGCGSLQGSPQPAPPVTSQPQEIQRNQTQGLTRMGTDRRFCLRSRVNQPIYLVKFTLLCVG